MRCFLVNIVKNKYYFYCNPMKYFSLSCVILRLSSEKMADESIVFSEHTLIPSQRTSQGSTNVGVLAWNKTYYKLRKSTKPNE